MRIAQYRETQRLLADYQARAKKHLGQNFIIDPSVVAKIARLSGCDQQSLTLEIGPGLGALTQELAENSRHVVAYEIDPIMVDILGETMAPYTNVSIIAQDFLKADLLPYQAEQRIIVCANVPYYITTPILFKLLNAQLPIACMTLMMQKEIAERLLASINSKAYSSLSILFQYFFTIEKVMKVSPQSFTPQPKVDSMVIQFTPKSDLDQAPESTFFDFVHACFNYRRKTLANNLKTLGIANPQEVLAACGLELNVRSEQVDTQGYIRLYQFLKKTEER